MDLNIHLIFLPFLMLLGSIINRLRGADYKIWIIKLSHVAKLSFGLLFGYICFKISNNYWSFLSIILYPLGESFGWGKWIGTCIDKKSRYDEKEGYRKIFGIEINDGIHLLANSIVKERDDFLLYSRIALMIRAVYWFLPLFILAAVLGCTSIIQFIIALLIISIAFPISIEIGRIEFDYIFIDEPDVYGNPPSWSDMIWRRAEVVKGAFQLLAVFILLM